MVTVLYKNMYKNLDTKFSITNKLLVSFQFIYNFEQLHDNFELKIDIKLNKITSFVFHHLKFNSLKLNRDIYV